MLDYQKGKIYKIVNSVTKKIYVGSTIQTLKKRMAGHKNNCNSKKSLKFNKPVSKYMRKYGFGNFKIKLIEKYPCENLLELRLREQYYIDLLKPQLNAHNAYTNKYEYNKQFRKANVEKHNEHSRKYYQKMKTIKVKCTYCDKELLKVYVKKHEKICCISTKHLI